MEPNTCILRLLLTAPFTINPFNKQKTRHGQLYEKMNIIFVKCRLWVYVFVNVWL